MLAHTKLSVWKDSINLVEDIYHITAKFPKSEIFGLTSQIRRSAISIPSDISQGAARNGPRDFKRFLRFSFGSLSELETQIEISYRLRYIDGNTYKNLQERVKKISAQLAGLIKSLEKK
jgi:four helix bundle protein